MLKHVEVFSPLFKVLVTSGCRMSANPVIRRLTQAVHFYFTTNLRLTCNLQIGRMENVFVDGPRASLWVPHRHRPMSDLLPPDLLLPNTIKSDLKPKYFLNYLNED